MRIYLFKLSLLILLLNVFEFAAIAQTSKGFGQKVNLDDVKIRGESNKGKTMLTQRKKISLDERIKVPKNFKKPILENLDDEIYGISNLETKRN